MMPSRHDRPPHIKHQTTYFRIPDRADTDVGCDERCESTGGGQEHGGTLY